MADGRALAAVLAVAFATSATAADFSEQLDASWTFGKPAESEVRFRAELAKYPDRSREALEIATQVARAQGLRKQYTDADATLDAVARALDAAPERVRVRYLLERGRVRNSSGNPRDAAPLFAEAIAISARDALPGADFYRIDALHMLGIAAPERERLGWNEKALAAALASADTRARGWAAALHNNIGWTYFDRGDPAIALVHWQKALTLREASGNAATIRIAKWTIARGYRALGRLDDAEAIQLSLVAETERANAPDRHVYEELAELAVARGNREASSQWTAKARALANAP